VIAILLGGLSLSLWAAASPPLDQEPAMPVPAAVTGAIPARRVPPGAALPPPPDPASIRATLITNFKRDQEAVIRYSHKEHVILVKNNVRDARTLLLFYINGHGVAETIALDNRQLSAAEIRAEHARAVIRAQAAAKLPPAPVGGLEFGGKTFTFSDLAADYLYSNPNVFVYDGRATWSYDLSPNPNAHSGSMEEQALLGSIGQIWIDAADRHVIRISLRTYKPVRYLGGFLATIHSGELDLLLKRHSPGEWLPQYYGFELDATIAFFKHIAESKQTTFSDYDPMTPAMLAYSRH
jgi:hypothetical protein